MKRGLVFFIGLTCAALGVWQVWRGRDQSSAPTAVAPSATYVTRSDRPGPALRGALIVNDQVEATIGTATPIYLQAVIRQTGTDALSLQRLTDIAPAVMLEDGTRPAVSLEWTAVGTWPESITGNAQSAIAWTTSGQLPPGRYVITFDGQTSSETSAPRVSIDPARLTVASVADAEEAEAAGIRVTLLQGDAADALVRLDAALARDPNHLLMQLWRAEALEELARPEEAAAQYEALMAAVSTRTTTSGVVDDLPYWLAMQRDRLMNR